MHTWASWAKPCSNQVQILFSCCSHYDESDMRFFGVFFSQFCVGTVCFNDTTFQKTYPYIKQPYVDYKKPNEEAEITTLNFPTYASTFTTITLNFFASKFRIQISRDAYSNNEHKFAYLFFDSNPPTQPPETRAREFRVIFHRLSSLFSH